MSDDAMEFLEKVEARAKKLYELSDQGSWAELNPMFKQRWINAAREDLVDRAEGEARS